MSLRLVFGIIVFKMVLMAIVGSGKLSNYQKRQWLKLYFIIFCTYCSLPFIKSYADYLLLGKTVIFTMPAWLYYMISALPIVAVVASLIGYNCLKAKLRH